MGTDIESKVGAFAGILAAVLLVALTALALATFDMSSDGKLRIAADSPAAQAGAGPAIITRIEL